jgi:very-short-patch-repair endonuclease
MQGAASTAVQREMPSGPQRTERGAGSSSLSRLRERVGVRARELRSGSTEAEQRLWHQLRSRRLADLKFRRQHPVSSFIADFACLEAKLIVEVDGGQHFEPDAMAADERRTQSLQRAGFTVLRFDNRQVLAEIDAVLAAIDAWLRIHRPHPNPLPHAGEGVNTKEPS